VKWIESREAFAHKKGERESSSEYYLQKEKEEESPSGALRPRKKISGPTGVRSRKKERKRKRVSLSPTLI